MLVVGCNKTPVEPVAKYIDQSNVPTADKVALASLEKRPATPFPFWARIEDTSILPHGMPETEEWGIIYFYVSDPSVIPDDFNLMNFVDFRAIQAEFSVEGYAWWLPDNSAPYLQLLHGKGVVPFWFITSEQATQIAADGVITMPELEGLDPIKGFAQDFFEELKPIGGGARVNGICTKAFGCLENGGSFHFKLKTIIPDGDIERAVVITQLELTEN